LRETGPGRETTEPIHRAIELSIAADFAKRLPDRDEWRDYQNTRAMRIVEAESLTYQGATPEPSLRLEIVAAGAHRMEATIRDLYSLALQNETPQQDLKADVVRILKQVDPGVQRIDLVQSGGTGPQLQIKHARTGVTPLSALGDGFRRALLIAVAIPAVQGGLLLIDELETALHVSVLDSVLGMLRWATKEFNVQVFATTHSLEAVDAVVRAFKEDPASVVGYRLERPEGRPLAKRLSGEALRELRFEMGLEFR
jgi:predicted ATPase